MHTDARNAILLHAKEVREISDTEQLAALLETGEWIAVLARRDEDGAAYVVMRIELPPPHTAS